jgi:cytochrome b subunit of formate dehydrogenase
LRKLVFIVAVVCGVVLAVTGFAPMLLLDKTITGWWLVIHATFAPVFAACVAILAVMWAGSCTFDKDYLPWLNRLIARKPQSAETPEKYELCRKALFWALLLLALPVILSAVLSMFPIFGTDGQENLLCLHRYSTLTFVLFGVIYLYLMVLTQMRRCAEK